ncbi:MAG: sulfatase [Endomicrobiales bacterium]|nr:sulfatase [Endomicrobiales bacterium]
MIKDYLRIIFITFLFLLIAFAVFYLSLVIPRDQRIEMADLPGQEFSVKHRLYYDFTEGLKNAKIKTGDLDSAKDYLAMYQYFQNHPSQHMHDLNMHLSLGWFPLKTDHRDCIMAPTPSVIEYALYLPENPILKFDYGIVSSIDRAIFLPASFKIFVIDRKKESHVVFEKTEYPLLPFRWKSHDGYYKNFYKYFHPQIQERDGKWNFAEVDLKDFEKQWVKIRFITENINLSDESFEVDGDACKTCDTGLCYGQALNVSDLNSYPKISTTTTLAFWAQPGIYTKVTEQKEPNVILIVIDSFRRDHLNSRFSPNLWRYAESGINFNKAFSNGNMTKLSVPSFLMSQPPSGISEISTHYEVTKKAREKFYERKLPTLLSKLKENRYRTAAIGSCSLFSDGQGFSADLGFDEVINLEHSGYSPPHVTKEGIKWLKAHGREKFFMMLYYDGPHGPYRPPLKYVWKSVKRGGILRNFRKILYLGEIIYHDDYIGQLRKYLEASGLDKDTIIIFTSDHGVTFRTLEYDWPTKFGPWRKKKVTFHSHGVSLIPEDINVPLFFVLPEEMLIPDVKNGLKIEDKIQLLDLAPTILDLLNLKIPKEFQGKSLKAVFSGQELKEEIVSFHQGWQNYGIYWKNEWLYVNNFAPRNKFPEESVVADELFNIIEDPLCENNLAYKHPFNKTLLPRMKRLLEAYVPKSKKYKVKFLGEKDRSVRVNLYAKGEISGIETSSEILNKGRRYCSFKLNPDDELSFRITPENLEFTINSYLDGRQVKYGEILVGRYALPMLDSYKITSSERDKIDGWPDDFRFIKGNRLLLGTVYDELTERKEPGKSSKQLRSMLEEWGYINQ